MNYLERILALVNNKHIASMQLLDVLQEISASWVTLDGIHIILGLLYISTGIGVVLFVGGFYLSKKRLLGNMVLSDVQATQKGYTVRTYSDELIGMKGTAQTPLRPSGKVIVRGRYHDAKTLGSFVAAGTTVVVTEISGTSLTVQAVVHQV
ncbi:MAG: NfeD family protein [Bacteroidota bacterium]